MTAPIAVHAPTPSLRSYHAPQAFTWSGSESEDEGLGCGVFDGAVSPGFTDEEEDHYLAAEEACRYASRI